MRIALVNDVKMAIEALRRVVESMPEASVAWIAEDGQQAVDKCQADRPDLVLMDLIMPQLDGVQATRQIMQASPCPILVVTATVTGNCSKVYEALGYGAVDAVNTPVLGRDQRVSGGEELIRKVRNVMRLQAAAAVEAPPGCSATVAASGRPFPVHVPLVVIGASTGGPQALGQVLTRLSPPLSFAVVVVQHLDPLFVPGLAEWLQQETGLPFQLIRQGDRPLAGTVHLASTTDHLVIGADGQFRYVREPATQVFRPSVDVFFTSLGQHRVRPGVAVLLTGMGRDGAAGLKSLREAGWQTIVQDQATSVIWGMPGAAADLDAADQVLPVHQIGPAIATHFRSSCVSP